MFISFEVLVCLMVIQTKVNNPVQAKAKQPVKKVDVFPIQVSVWENLVKTQDSEYTSHSVTIEKSYKDKDGNWQKTQSFNVSDLPKLQLALNDAYVFLVTSKKVTQE